MTVSWKMASSAVISLPSCHFMPLRISNVTSIFPLLAILTSPFSTDGSLFSILGSRTRLIAAGVPVSDYVVNRQVAPDEVTGC